MSKESNARKVRMAETVRKIVTRRERAPRSPRLERAFKSLIWRYHREQDCTDQGIAGGLEGDGAAEGADQAAHGA